MEYIIGFNSDYYNRAELDAMTDEERWNIALSEKKTGSYNAQIVTLEEWTALYNIRLIPEGVYIYPIDK